MKANWSIFDVIGPVMIGPSSSHTAGAAKIGYIARELFDEEIHEVKIELHGSFGEVYVGHNTDKAILGGLLGFLPHDERIANAFDEAKQRKVDYSILPVNLGKNTHQNTTKITMKNTTKEMEIIGSSLGGGKVEIIRIDKFEVNISDAFSPILVAYSSDCNFSSILSCIAGLGENVVKVDTSRYKDTSLTIISTKHINENLSIIDVLKNMDGVFWVKYLTHVSHSII